MRAIISVFLVSAVAVAPGSAEDPKDYKTVDPAAPGVELVKPAKDPKTGFVVGGKNDTALVRRLAELNGRAIADLEKDMRPGAKSDVGSDEGFLGARESLLAVLEADNEYVVGGLELTHQELARHLRVLAAIGLKRLDDAREAKKDGPADPFTYRGRRFTIAFEFTKGYQLSPFRDGTKTNTYVKLVNADTGKKLAYSLLVPDMIERYGFYEGTGTPYRVAPRDIVAMLDFLKPKHEDR